MYHLHADHCPLSRPWIAPAPAGPACICGAGLPAQRRIDDRDWRC